MKDNPTLYLRLKKNPKKNPNNTPEKRNHKPAPLSKQDNVSLRLNLSSKVSCHLWKRSRPLPPESDFLRPCCFRATPTGGTGGSNISSVSRGVYVTGAPCVGRPYPVEPEPAVPRRAVRIAVRSAHRSHRHPYRCTEGPVCLSVCVSLDISLSCVTMCECVCVCVYLSNCTYPRNPALSS